MGHFPLTVKRIASSINSLLSVILRPFAVSLIQFLGAYTYSMLSQYCNRLSGFSTANLHKSLYFANKIDILE